MQKTPVSVIFTRLYSILSSMKTNKTPEPSGKATAGLVSAVGLIFVWMIIWANLPSREEWSLAQSPPSTVQAPNVPELDLTIPGSPIRLMDQSAGAGETASSEIVGGLSVPSDSRTRQIAEVKCDAEVQQSCPDSLTGEARRRCVQQRLPRLDPPCQQIVRQRLVRWKEAEGYRLACVDDVKRLCRTVPSGNGRILQCLQEHEQELSEQCYLSLPKGRLQLRN